MPYVTKLMLVLQFLCSSSSLLTLSMVIKASFVPGNDDIRMVVIRKLGTGNGASVACTCSTSTSSDQFGALSVRICSGSFLCQA
jgi:hypothetical protein